MNSIRFPNFNHSITLLGGQTFTWKLMDSSKNEYIGITQDKIIKIRYDNGILYWQTYPEKDDEEFINNYFGMDIDYDQILQTIKQDKYIERAAEEFPNIRILKQPLDITIISFIISANNNIKAIRKSIWLLAELFGDVVSVGDRKIPKFPTTSTLADLPLEELKRSRIGYHAKYVKKSAQLLLNKKDFYSLGDLEEEEARERLKTLPGVGDKVADCVLKFALGFGNISPVDVWVRRLLNDLYDVPKDSSYEFIRNWVKENFYGYASWADQFLFEWYRAKQSRGE
jgi:N-glycosylase/DNA lyase